MEDHVYIEKKQKTAGVLYGIGVGPGDPELITVKALKTIQGCDMIVLPAASKESCHAYNIVKQIYPEIEQKALRFMPFPMIKDEKKLDASHDEIFWRIEDELILGKSVGLLTIGDPSVYSTYMYIHHRAKAAGYEAVMISGVPSFCAAAARLGISLGERADEIHVIPAAYEIQGAFAEGGTCVYMKSGKHLAQLAGQLKKEREAGRKFSVYGISDCGMDSECVYTTLEELECAMTYLTTVIVKPEHAATGVSQTLKYVL